MLPQYLGDDIPKKEIDRGTIKMSACTMPEDHLFRSPRMHREDEKRAIEKWKKCKANNFEYDPTNEPISTKPTLSYSLVPYKEREFRNPGATRSSKKVLFNRDMYMLEDVSAPIDVNNPIDWIHGTIEPPHTCRSTQFDLPYETVLAKHEELKEYWVNRDFEYEISGELKLEVENPEEIEETIRNNHQIQREERAKSAKKFAELITKDGIIAPTSEELLDRYLQALKDNQSFNFYATIITEEEKYSPLLEHVHHIYMKPSYQTITVLAHLYPRELWFLQNTLISDFREGRQVYIDFFWMGREFADTVTK